MTVAMDSTLFSKPVRNFAIWAWKLRFLVHTKKKSDAHYEHRSGVPGTPKDKCD